MPAMVRKKIKWPTKRRKGGMRVWKTKWVMVAQQTPPAKRGGGGGGSGGGGGGEKKS